MNQRHEFKEVTVTVPGKIMLAGEYAVLEGGSSLAFTVNRFLKIHGRVTPGEVTVESDLWDEALRLNVPTLEVQHNEPLVEAALTGVATFGLPGATFKVESELDVTFGLGSSSALRLGVLIACRALAEGREGAISARDEMRFWEDARTAWMQQKQQQNRASGYDIVTQLAGGLVRMEPEEGAWPGKVDRLPHLGQNVSDLVHIFVGGKGAPTKQVTSETREWLQEQRLDRDILALSAALESQFCQTLQNPDDEALYLELCEIVGRHRRLFRASPHFPIRIARALEALPGLDQNWSYKTTGAGGEDAILIIGRQDRVRHAKETLLKMGWFPFSGSYSDEGAFIHLGEPARV